MTWGAALNLSEPWFPQMSVVLRISLTQGCEAMCMKGLLFSSVRPSLPLVRGSQASTASQSYSSLPKVEP